MADRLESLVADETGVDDCCEEDAKERRRELNSLSSSVEQTVDERAVETLSALGDPTRYRAVCALVERGDEMCVCELDIVLDVSESAVSHALQNLRGAGLVEREKRGRWRYYGATDRAERLVGALEDG